MRQILSIFFVFCGFIAFCQAPSEQIVRNSLPEPFTIKVDAARAKQIADFQGSNLVLIDVRTAEEVQKRGRIRNAINVDMSQPGFEKSLLSLDNTKQYMVYDYVGGKSGKMVALLKKMGFRQVYEVTDGFKAWSLLEKATAVR